MTHQKFLFENFIELSAKEVCLWKHNDGKNFFKNLLPEQKELINNSHLYFVCKKPKLNFIPGTLSYDKDVLQVWFELSSANKTLKQPGCFYHYSDYFNNPVAFALNESDPSKLIIYYQGNSSRTVPTEYIFPIFDAMPYNDFSQFPDHSIVDYEVLYIGQSVGRKKKSNAFIRTNKNHHKLEKILSYISKYERYYEIFLLFASIQPPYNIALCDGRFVDNEYTKNNSLQNLKDLTASHNIKKVVNLMEACLIKYFDPKYNEVLKHKPILGTEAFIKKYKENYDINTVLTVIDTSRLPYVSLFSPTRKTCTIHKIYNTIHKEDDRIRIEDIIFTPDVL